MASLEDLLRQTQASYQFYLDNPGDQFNYDYTEPMVQPMEQTMMQPLTQNISTLNYIMPDMYEDDDEGASYNLNFNPSITGGSRGVASKNQTIGGLFNTQNMLTGLASLVGKNLTGIPILGNVGSMIYDSINPKDNIDEVTYFDKELAKDQTLGGETGLGLGLSDDEIAGFDEDLRSEQAQQSQATQQAEAAAQAVAQQSFMDQLADARLSIEQSDDGGGGTGSGENEGGSGADSGSGTHDDPGD